MSKKFLLLMLIFICVLILCSCSINPYAFQWKLFGIYHDVTYVNGQTVTTWTSTGAYEHQPNGIHDGMVSIKFYEDGTVDFKPYGSEMLHGTYTLKHNGMKDTSFTVVFDNGERIENGYAVGYYYNDELNFDFRGIRYKFSTDSRGCTEEEYEQERANLADWIRRGGMYLRNGEVKLNENDAELCAESLENNIDLYGENCALTLIQITAENELVTLDGIKEGECVFYEFFDTKQPHGKDIHTVVIYYIEPLPQQEEYEPQEYTLDELNTRLQYYFEHPEESIIKVSRTLNPAQSGQNDYHKYYMEKADVDKYISALREVTLTEELDKPVFGDIEMVYTVRFSHIEGQRNGTVITLIGDYVKFGEKYYRVSSFPDFEYDGAVMTFTMLNNDLKVYSKDEYMYDADGYLFDVEFIIDPEQNYEYMTSHYTITLICELGEITVYDATHFWYKGQFYLVVSEKNFSEFY